MTQNSTSDSPGQRMPTTTKVVTMSAELFYLPFMVVSLAKVVTIPAITFLVLFKRDSIIRCSKRIAKCLH
ncbi:MAG: hypothetical protein MRJ93_05300 [Nitrososphaeraceae archaeon]|nr:hypothetical protein [Nitrososphaeraceae archaeon]